LASKSIAPIFQSPLPKPVTPRKTDAHGPKHQGSDPLTFEGQAWSGYAKYQEHPDAKRLVANNEWRMANTAANAEVFIEGYYQNSRCVLAVTRWQAGG
jgi:hypothetical protein